jgi:hypothetical protein
MPEPLRQAERNLKIARDTLLELASSSLPVEGLGHALATFRAALATQKRAWKEHPWETHLPPKKDP